MDIRGSIAVVLVVLIPPSVLLRCSTGFEFSAEPDDEAVLLRECWLLAFFAISLSFCASRNCVSYGCLDMSRKGCCGILPKEEVISGLEKLSNMLGSTPADVYTNEPGLEPCLCEGVFANDAGMGDAWKLWNAGVCIILAEGWFIACQFMSCCGLCGVGPKGSTPSGTSRSICMPSLAGSQNSFD
jgi:hypothetical protein